MCLTYKIKRKASSQNQTNYLTDSIPTQKVGNERATRIMSVFSHVEFDQHENVVFGHDTKTGLKAIIAIHNTKRGPALGGCRMWPYASDEEALNDALRLSKGMTYKSAIARLPLGGGKAVILGDPRKDKSPELLHAMGSFIDGLSGKYITAEDSGTSVADMKLIAERTDYVSGLKTDGISDGDPSPSTALGTFVGIQAAVRHKFNQQDLNGLKVAIQGVGNVGNHLAHHLKNAGAEIFVCDIHQANVEHTTKETGATAVNIDDIYSLDVDIFAPCAMGAIINDRTIDVLQAKIIAGAANNQLATPNHGEILQQKGILYAPDYVINAGGIIDISYQRGAVSGNEQEKQKHVEGIADTLSEIFSRSEQQGIATHAIADTMAEELF